MAPDRPALRIGISSCLLGEETRYDGGHKRDDFLVRTVGRLVEWVPVCPEVEIGLGTPRETIRLVRDAAGGLSLLGSKSGADHTAPMRRFGRKRSAQLQRQCLSGYIFKKGSPSCGSFRVKVFDHRGTPRASGRGMFAQAITDAMPMLPVEEEGRLYDAQLRDSFFTRAFAYRRVTDLFARRWRSGDLRRFHAAEKLLLLAHDRSAWADLERFLATVGDLGSTDVPQRYTKTFMAGLAKAATTRKHAQVLRHLARTLKTLLDDNERAGLAAAIEDYSRELLPLLVPITLIRHHVRRHGIDTLVGQTYLEPHAAELLLRNHA